MDFKKLNGKIELIRKRNIFCLNLINVKHNAKKGTFQNM